MHTIMRWSVDAGWVHSVGWGFQETTKGRSMLGSNLAHRLATVIAVACVSELVLTAPVFGSAYNAYHLP